MTQENRGAQAKEKDTTRPPKRRVSRYISNVSTLEPRVTSLKWLDSGKPSPTQRPLHGCVPVNFKLPIQASEIMVQSAKMLTENIFGSRPDLQAGLGSGGFALLAGWRNR